ncbi:hypothetical protein ACFL6U_32895, partial [Planctomycetota bacterium]
RKNSSASSESSGKVKSDDSDRSRLQGGEANLFVFSAIILPALALGFEWCIGGNAWNFFDPIPSFLHVLVIACVPVGNLWTLIAIIKKAEGQRRTLAWINAVLIGITGYYAFLFLPILVLACIGILCLGLGFLPLAPMLGFISTSLIRRHIHRYGSKGNVKIPHLGLGLLLAGVIILVLDGPIWLTHMAMQGATSYDSTVSQQDIRWLKSYGDRKTLWAACFGSNRSEFGKNTIERFLYRQHSISVGEARSLYFRVTGRAFSEVLPPLIHRRTGSHLLRDFGWDEERGGDQVGGPLRGIMLHSSRFDVIVEPEPAMGYCEWILEFRNDNRRAQEARAQVLLPPGGVVSRVTLWVDGQEREAAFAGHSHVRQAYQQVAIRDRRDPVLVTSRGPDRVLVQCFPILPQGGTMKIRLGITAPLLLDEAGQGLWRWPAITEKNFTIPESTNHTIHMTSPQPMTGNALLTHSNGEPGTLTGRLNNMELNNPENIVKVSRMPEASIAWTPDIGSTDNIVIRQVIKAIQTAKPEHVIVVLDASYAVRKSLPRLSRMMFHAAPDIQWRLVLAANNPIWLYRSNDTGSMRDILPRRLRKVQGQGGYDNLPALNAAWEEARMLGPKAAILWIHGPIPVLLSSTEPLRHKLQQPTQSNVFFSFQLASGPNRILEKLNIPGKIHEIPHTDRVHKILSAMVTKWHFNTTHYSFHRQQIKDTNDLTPANRVSFYLARLWANEEVTRLRKARRLNEAAELAARYQIVTPVSGAVVLETDQQYEDNDLDIPDSALSPVIPAPASILLVLIGMVVLLI